MLLSALQHNKPLYSFEDNADYVYDVMWSPVHPALFACVDGMGRLDLWNLNNDTEVRAGGGGAGSHPRGATAPPSSRGHPEPRGDRQGRAGQGRAGPGEAGPPPPPAAGLPRYLRAGGGPAAAGGARLGRAVPRAPPGPRPRSAPPRPQRHAERGGTRPARGFLPSPAFLCKVCNVCRETEARRRKAERRFSHCRC